MCTAESNSPLADFAIDDGSPAAPGLHINMALVAGQDLDALVGQGRCVDKEPAAVEVGMRRLGHRARSREGLPIHDQPGSPSAALAVVGEAPEDRSPAGAREEAQLSRPDDLERLVANLKLAHAAAVVGAGAKPEIPAAAADVLRDDPVPLAAEDAAVAEVSAAGHDEEGARCRPWLSEQRVLLYWDDGVVGI